jgi:hypothetical protein
MPFGYLVSVAASSAVAYAELPGAQHDFDLFRSIRFEAVIGAVERFARVGGEPEYRD